MITGNFGRNARNNFEPMKNNNLAWGFVIGMILGSTVATTVCTVMLKKDKHIPATFRPMESDETTTGSLVSNPSGVQSGPVKLLFNLKNGATKSPFSTGDMIVVSHENSHQTFMFYCADSTKQKFFILGAGPSIDTIFVNKVDTVIVNP